MIENKFGRWWAADESDVHRDVTATVDHIRTLSRARYERDKKHMRLYCPDVSGNAGDFISLLKRDCPTFNLIAQGVDTMVAQVGATKYLPKYIVTAGSFDLQRTSRLRTKVLEGQVTDLGIAELLTQAFQDACIVGTGHLVGFLDPETKEPRIERALPGEIVVDPRDAIGAMPLSMYRRRAMSRETAEELAGTGLKGAAGPSSVDHGALFLPKDSSVDEVWVTEAWHAPMGKQTGRHVICTSTQTILDEDWQGPIPVITVRFQQRQLGYWGLGIAEIGAEIQALVDRKIARNEESEHLGSTAWLITYKQAKVRFEKLSNAPMTHVQVDGPPGYEPKVQVLSGKLGDLVEEVDRWRERFLSMTGISVMAAENKRPAGLDSAPAQRTYANLSSQRHQPVAERLKAAWKDTFELLEALNTRAQEEKGDYSIAARTTRGLVPLVRTVRWSDAHLPKEQYRLSLQLVSDVPYSVAGRVQATEEWVASGFSSRPFAQAQSLETPSDDYQRLELADLDYVMWQVEEILDGRDAELDPYQNANIAADVVRRVYLTVKSQGAPEDVMKKLRKFVDDALPPQAPQPTMPQGTFKPPAAEMLRDYAPNAGPAQGQELPA